MKPFTLINKALTFTLAAAALTFASCKKDQDNNNPDPSAQSHQLVKFEDSATSYTTFDYNTNGQITKMVASEDGQNEEFTVTYNASKRPSQITSGESSIKFNYAGNLLNQADIYSKEAGQENMTSYIKYSYNGTLVSEAVSYMPAEEGETDIPLSKATYEYYPNGDVKKQTNYMNNPVGGEYALSNYVVYEYDTKSSPFNSLTELYYLAFQMPSKHNPVKETTYDSSNNVISTTTYTYTYDNDGYPTKGEKKTLDAGETDPVVNQLKYIYK